MRYFYVKITQGSSTSTYTINYRSFGGTVNYANRFNITNSTTSIATGITFQEMVSENGVLVELPDDVEEVLVDDELDNTCQLLSIYTGPSATITTTSSTCGLSTISVSNITGGTKPYIVSVNGSLQLSTGQTITFEKVGGTIADIIITDTSNPSKTSSKKINLSDNSQFGTFEIINYPSTSTSSDGVIKVSTTGGTFNKTYYLYKNINYPDSLECLYDTITKTITGVTSETAIQTITGLTCGAYCFRAVDSNFCEVQTELYSVCSTPVQPQTIYNRVSVRYGGTINDVCTGGTAVFIFSENNTALVDGQTYTDFNGNPIDGLGGGYYKNSGTDDCSYGTINQFGVWYSSGTCSNCL